MDVGAASSARWRSELMRSARPALRASQSRSCGVSVKRTLPQIQGRLGFRRDHQRILPSLLSTGFDTGSRPRPVEEGALGPGLPAMIVPSGPGPLAGYYTPACPPISASPTEIAKPRARRIWPAADTTRGVPTTGATAIMTPSMSAAVSPARSTAEALAR
jgi:hypothetical protein